MLNIIKIISILLFTSLLSACNDSTPLTKADMRVILLEKKALYNYEEQIHEYFSNINFKNTIELVSRRDYTNYDHNTKHQLYNHLFDTLNKKHIYYYSSIEGDLFYKSTFSPYKDVERNEELNVLIENLNKLLAANPNNSLLLESLTHIEKVKQRQLDIYNDYKNDIENNRYISLDTLHYLTLELYLLNSNHIRKPIVDLSKILPFKLLDDYSTFIENFDEKIKNKEFLSKKMKKFQVENMTYTTKEGKCFSHTLNGLEVKFNQEMEISFNSSSVDTNIIDCKLIKEV